MIKIIKVMLLSLVLMISCLNTVLGNSFVCNTDSITGFAYDKVAKEWKQTNFKDKQVYMINPSNEKDRKFDLDRVGYDMYLGKCEDDINTIGFLFCEHAFGVFKLNTINNRYVATNHLGYIDAVSYTHLTLPTTPYV